VNRVAEGPPLWHRQVLSDPAQHGLVTLRRLVEPEETTPLG
jgi:hypothetical protein